MGQEVVECLADVLRQPGAIHLDATFGRGGHTRMVLEQFPECSVIACDQDADAIAYGEQHFAPYIESRRLQLVRSNFSQVTETVQSIFHTVLMDLGVSSPQLDQAERGFSFQHDGPLDMRMDQRLKYSAADIINSWSESELNDLFKEFGEIRSPYRVVRAVVHDRKTDPFTSTLQLAGLIARVEGWRKKGFHPATQFFMALRLQVNQELTELKTGLDRLVPRLVPGGRMAVITFHSLEDRIVKNDFKMHELGRPLFKKVITPTIQETKSNSRARSAKLRVFERTPSGEIQG